MDISIIDYGTGNLHSLGKALERGGARVRIETDLDAALHADGIVLPGVGAFGAVAGQLAGARDALHRAIAAGQPCLGICLGMQLLFETSDEGGGAGLGALSGHVRRIRGRRVPHIGWNEVEMMDDPLFAGIPRLLVYYANSYVADLSDTSEAIGWTRYGDELFPAVVRRDNVWGVQFHPEKSGASGLQLLGNFLSQVRR